MQLTLATDYAIRTVLYLAQQKRIVPTGEISEAMHCAEKQRISPYLTS